MEYLHNIQHIGKYDHFDGLMQLDYTNTKQISFTNMLNVLC